MFGHVGGKAGRDGEGGWLSPQKSFENYVSHIFGDHEVDVFLHTWSMDQKNEILELYNPVASIIEPQTDFSDIEMSRYPLTHLASYRDLFLAYDENVVEEVVRPLIFRSHSRWCSTRQSIQLMSQYAAQKQVRYDWVVQLRFDLFFLKRLHFESMDPELFLHTTPLQRRRPRG